MTKPITLIAILIANFHFSINAGEVDIPNAFTAGTPAVAADVNANFTAVETAVDGNAIDIAALLATVTAMEARLTTLEADNTVLIAQTSTLEADISLLQSDNTLLQNLITEVVPYMQGGSDAQGNPTVFFSGANVHVNNGSSTDINGLGNLVIGYDTNANPGSSHGDFCTVVDTTWAHAYTSQSDCENNGGEWGNDSQKIGSHYLIIGNGNSYTQSGGIVTGSQNVANGGTGHIIGGRFNIASGSGSNIYGGQSNLASGFFSTIVAGRSNISSGSESNVTGGESNIASGTRSSVSGGEGNIASGIRSIISGGEGNTATGSNSSISGGDRNIASGVASSVSGGLRNEASALWGTVGGGADRDAADEADWAAGTLIENF